MSQLEICILEKSARECPADILALTHVQALFGRTDVPGSRFGGAPPTSEDVLTEPSSTESPRISLADRLLEMGIDISESIGKQTELFIPDSRGLTASKSILLLDMSFSEMHRYEPIRVFCSQVLKTLATHAPRAEHIAMTTHGVWQGLDELEAFACAIAGIADAVTTLEFPAGLKKISICDRNPGRAARLRIGLARMLPGGFLPIPRRAGEETFTAETKERLRSAGQDSTDKPHIFVAMPYSEDMDDVYHFGIQSAVREAGYLCERADFSSFTGPAMEWIRKRIQTSSLVIADLTRANPNVYLEVGYAWGCGRPTVLLARDESELKFDVHGFRCLFYRRIKDLEQSLGQELRNLRTTL